MRKLFLAASALAGAFFAINGVSVGHSPSFDPGSALCTNPQLEGATQKMISGMSWPLGGGKIQLLKAYNYRDNPVFKPDNTDPDMRPCKVSLLTDRGEFGFVYGTKQIDGDWYILGQISDPAD